MSIGLRLSPQHRVYAGFAIYAFSLGNIFPRLPDIKAAMGVQEGALGLGLIGMPVGTLLALTFASPLLETDRLSARVAGGHSSDDGRLCDRRSRTQSR